MATGKSFSESNFELVHTRAGALSIRNRILDETMHNPVGPWAEANELYVQQSGLYEKLTDSKLIHQDLVLFDVGLGAASNVLAAVDLYYTLVKKNTPVRPFRVISFEEDLSLLSFTLKNAEAFEHVKKYQPLLDLILRKGHFVDPDFSFHWELRHGNFLDLIEVETEFPEIIFYDPYSPRVNSEMWSYYCFRKLYHLCNQAQTPAHLLTYSRATPVRVGLMVAGFYVGSGRPSGLKNETTEASTKIFGLPQPLGARWFERWKRSETPLPIGGPREINGSLTLARVEEVLKAHPQFVATGALIQTDAFRKILQKFEKSTLV